MKKVKVEEGNHDWLIDLIKKYNGEIKTLNQALEYLRENWDEITAPQGEDGEKQLLREEIGVLKKRIEQLEKEIKEKDAIIESLRNQDTKLLKEQMRIEWEREKLEKQLEQKKIELEIKKLVEEKKAIIEIFKALCRSGKLDKMFCETEMGEFLRKELGIDEVLKEGEG